MDIVLYRKYLVEYVRAAYVNSDGSKYGMAEYLGTISYPGRFTRHKEEKRRALSDARIAFDEHRHWPLDIIVSHLGLDKTIIK